MYIIEQTDYLPTLNYRVLTKIVSVYNEQSADLVVLNLRVKAFLTCKQFGQSLIMYRIVKHQGN